MDIKLLVNLYGVLYFLFGMIWLFILIYFEKQGFSNIIIDLKKTVRE